MTPDPALRIYCFAPVALSLLHVFASAVLSTWDLLSSFLYLAKFCSSCKLKPPSLHLSQPFCQSLGSPNLVMSGHLCLCPAASGELGPTSMSLFPAQGLTRPRFLVPVC